METSTNVIHHEPWNKGKIVGQKAPFKVKDIWALRVLLQMEGRVRGCDLVSFRVRDVTHGDQVANPEDFLRVLPGKPLLGPAASSIGINKERYCELVKTALNSNESAFAALREALEHALAPYLPPRVIQGSGEHGETNA